MTEGQGNPKEDAAQVLSNLSQTSFAQHLPVHYQTAGTSAIPGIPEGGAHRVPPNLGQLSAVAMQAAPVNVQAPGQQQEDGNAGDDAQNLANASDGSQAPAGGGRRNANRASMSTDEWTRQRKDNHVRFLICYLIIESDCFFAERG